MRLLLLSAILFVGTAHGQIVKTDCEHEMNEYDSTLLEEFLDWEEYGFLIAGRVVKQSPREAIMFFNYEGADLVIFVKNEGIIKMVLNTEELKQTTEWK